MIIGAPSCYNDIKFLCYYLDSSVTIRESEDLIMEVEGSKYENIEEIARKLFELNKEEATPEKIKSFKSIRKAPSTKIPIDKTVLCVLNCIHLIEDMVLKASLKNRAYIDTAVSELLLEPILNPYFFLLNIRAGEIKSIAAVEGMDKIYHEQVVMDREYSICSGLRAHYSEKDLQGNTYLFVANGKKAKFKGVTSEGMIICAKKGNEIDPLAVAAEPGTTITLEGQQPFLSGLIPAAVDLSKASYRAILNKFKIVDHQLTFDGKRVFCGTEPVRSAIDHGDVS